MFRRRGISGLIHVGSSDFCLFAVHVLLDDTNTSGFCRLATFITAASCFNIFVYSEMKFKIFFCLL
jgi:hypothetical protein